jgi:hypothetical protein
MSTIPARRLEHNRNKPDSRNHEHAPLAKRACDDEEVRRFASGGDTPTHGPQETKNAQQFAISLERRNQTLRDL